MVGGGAAGVGDFWASHLNSPWLNDLHTCKKGQPLKLQNFVLKLLQIFSLECDFGTTMFIRSCIIFARPFNLFRSFIRHTWHIYLRWTKLGLVITLITVITKFSFCTTHNKLKQLCIPFGPVNLYAFLKVSSSFSSKLNMVLIQLIPKMVENVANVSLIQLKFKPSLGKSLTHNPFVNTKSFVKLSYVKGPIKAMIPTTFPQEL